jgi:signal transduction histidine kinase
LRSDLIQQASVVGGVSLALLLAAWAAVLYFARRGEVLEEQAAERERMAYLGTLAAGLAHEIRNPLNSLNLNMQLIAEELGPRGHDSSRLLAITRDEIGRLERLVTDFLAYARPRPPELAAVAVRPLLERVAALVAADAEAASASVVVDVDDTLTVRGDRAQLTQLLLNLAHNAVAAIAAAERPGVVRLTGSREPGSREFGPREAGRTVLAVEDDGIGIPEQERERIFEVFFSTKKGGTGLGLAIAERIATAHGGAIEVTSTSATAPSGGLTSSSGTQVRVVLPSEEAYSAPVSAS